MQIDILLLAHTPQGKHSSLTTGQYWTTGNTLIIASHIIWHVIESCENSIKKTFSIEYKIIPLTRYFNSKSSSKLKFSKSLLQACQTKDF